MAAQAGPAGSNGRSVVGSIQAHGAVRVGEVLVPAQSTLFAGDRVQTNNGGAVILYRQGARVTLASESVAGFDASRVQLEKGLMSFQTDSGGVVFAVSTLRQEPGAAKTAGNVNFQGSKASVSVTEGTLNVIDPSGVQLASLRAGEARLFEETAASAEPASVPSAAAAPPAAPPQGGGTGLNAESRKWLIGVGAAVVGASLGVAGLVRANDANDRADAADANARQAQTLANQLQSQNAALTAQVSALRAQATALLNQLASLSSASAQARAIQVSLANQLATLSRLEAQLADAQRQTIELLSQIARQGGQATPAQLQQLQSLSTLVITINAQIGTVTTQIVNDGQALNSIIIVVISPTRAS